MLVKLNQHGHLVNLPKTGKLTNGQTVSNYHRLPEEVLLAEGWLPLIEIRPEINEETHYLRIKETYEVEGEIRRVYESIEKVEPTPYVDPLDELRELIADLTEIVLEV